MEKEKEEKVMEIAGQIRPYVLQSDTNKNINLIIRLNTGAPSMVKKLCQSIIIHP